MTRDRFRTLWGLLGLSSLTLASVSDVPYFVVMSSKDLAALGLHQGPLFAEVPLSF